MSPGAPTQNCWPGKAGERGRERRGDKQPAHGAGCLPCALSPALIPVPKANLQGLLGKGNDLGHRDGLIITSYKLKTQGKIKVPSSFLRSHD